MYLLILLNQLIASLTHIIAKDITSYTEPALVLLFRALIASSCFAVYLIFFRKNKVPFEKKDIPILLILSAINIPINQFLFVESVKLTSAPNVSLAYSLSPVFVFILSSSILKEMPTAKKMLGILIAVIGTIVVISQNEIDFDSILSASAAAFSFNFTISVCAETCIDIKINSNNNSLFFIAYFL